LFSLAWNAPQRTVYPRYRIHFPLEQFEIVAYPTEGFVGQNLTIFYKDRLGLYPYYEHDGTSVNGGLPQEVSLSQHYEEMPRGVQKYIREPHSKGLAVIDWEEWRPLWIRNWNSKDIYRRKSRFMVAQKNPDWLPERVSKVAQQEFELSAKKFMLETLRIAKNLRPHQLWGFYLFPDCYNHDYTSDLNGYTGRCPDLEVTRNDQLAWLWTESTALFPSIYIASGLGSTSSGRHFVRNRVKEGMRLASTGDGVARPVFVYTRPTYTNELTLLTEVDLVSTIGESVALGVAGVILWGDASYASISTGASGPIPAQRIQLGGQCSDMLCHSHGRCLRRQPDTDTYLHLNPSSHSITLQDGQWKVTGKAGRTQLADFRTHFQCQCYSGYRGEGCGLKEKEENRASS
ncbi:hypothetical protein CRUP_021477, partial [Coryphaenoides rupestris]